MTPVSTMLSEPCRKGSPVFFRARPLRIAMLSIHSSPLGELGTGETGGMSVYIRELSRELGKAGHSIDIYTCADDGQQANELFLSENVRLTHLRIGRAGDVTKNSLPGLLPEVSRTLEEHITNSRTCYDLVHSHYWLSGMAASLARDKWFTPHIIMFHTTGIAKRLACSGEKEPNHRLISERRLAHSSDRILTATEREKDLLMRCYGVPREKIGTVPCGVNTDRFRPVARDQARKELGLQDAGFVVLYVGRFAPVKGLDRLIGAAAHLRSRRGLTFVVIGGDGLRSPASAELRRLARKASVADTVRFQGRVEHELLPLYYNAADVLVVPSYYESFGLVALESLSCGTPVIATRVGAMDTLIRDGKTGLLIDNPAPLSLAAAIERFIEDPSSVSIPHEGIRSSVLSYDWSHIASAIVREYRDAIGTSIGGNDLTGVRKVCIW